MLCGQCGLQHIWSVGHWSVLVHEVPVDVAGPYLSHIPPPIQNLINPKLSFASEFMKFQLVLVCVQLIFWHSYIFVAGRLFSILSILEKKKEKEKALSP